MHFFCSGFYCDIFVHCEVSSRTTGFTFGSGAHVVACAVYKILCNCGCIGYATWNDSRGAIVWFSRMQVREPCEGSLFNCLFCFCLRFYCLPWFPRLLCRWRLLSQENLYQEKNAKACGHQTDYIRRLWGSVAQSSTLDLVRTSFAPLADLRKNAIRPIPARKGSGKFCSSLLM